MDLVAIRPGLIIWTIITFIALLVVLRAFAWKPLLAVLDVDTAIEEGTAVRKGS